MVDGEIGLAEAIDVVRGELRTHRDQVRLSLDRDVSALAIPIPLCTEVTRILTQRRCAPPVLAHPYTPDHHILLTGERYGVTLPRPPQVHRITGVLLLPPTQTHENRSLGSDPRTRTPCDCAARSIFSGPCVPR